MAGSSSGMTRADEVMAKLGKARVKKSKTNWSWEDEEMMYETNSREGKRQKRRLLISQETWEQKRAKKDEKLNQMYMREERKLFLGGLAEETTEKVLREVFEEFGQIVDCKVMRDHDTGKSRGFGFVSFTSTFMTENALDKGPFDICGVKITPKRATPDVCRFRQTNAELFLSNNLLDQMCKDKRGIFVGALRDEISEEDLENYFSGFGRVVR